MLGKELCFLMHRTENFKRGFQEIPDAGKN